MAKTTTRKKTKTRKKTPSTKKIEQKPQNPELPSLTEEVPVVMGTTSDTPEERAKTITEKITNKKSCRVRQSQSGSLQKS